MLQAFKRPRPHLSSFEVVVGQLELGEPLAAGTTSGDCTASNGLWLMD